MKTILLTGGCGFIGSHLVERLVGGGYRVINLDALTYAGDVANVSSVAKADGYVFVHGDIGDSTLVQQVLSEHQPDVVFNLAAESHVDRSIDDAQPFLQTNVMSVYALLAQCLVYWRNASSKVQSEFLFVQMSTDEVYGSIDTGMFTEQSNYAPNSPYAASKAAGDHLVRSFRVTHGLPTAIVHASNTYGPRQFPEKLIPHMISNALAGQPLPVYGRGAQIRDWLYADDLAAGLEQVVKDGEDGGVYNFSGGDERQNIDTVTHLCGLLDELAPGPAAHSNTIAYVEDRPGHDMRYAMSNAYVGKRFGWTPATSFTEGLRATVTWYLDNRDWTKRIAAKGYDLKRIGTG